MSSDSWLVESQGPEPGQSFTLDQERLTVGRDPSNDIVINDPQVSRQHARITQQPTATVIEDLGSTNGTFVNGMRLVGPHVLANGDVIGLGDAVLLTYYRGERADSEETVVGRAPAPPPPGPPPSPAAAFSSTPLPPTSAPPAKRSAKSWLWIGCAVVVLAAAVACAAVFALDYFGMLPPIIYEPFKWLGIFN
jgi:hypothetical protein